MVNTTSYGGTANGGMAPVNEGPRTEGSPLVGSEEGGTLPLAEVGGLQGIPRRPVDINIMKRNMSIAKGFMDISLLSANANQLRHLLNFGNDYENTYYVIFTGLILSILLQLATGVILILKERFDISVFEHKSQAELLNNITICFVFLILIINIFVSSLGVEVMHKSLQHSGQGSQQSGLQGVVPEGPPA
ncbi:ninjurin-1-like [Oratosquilla oratoria]|uniref:ninjurin-1-like n=1 Tax=Oratosquilla oratoria TaxID=337810 RepID=UPI003F763DE6